MKRDKKYEKLAYLTKRNQAQNDKKAFRISKEPFRKTKLTKNFTTTRKNCFTQGSKTAITDLFTINLGLPAD